jgi:hypothetical protein
VTKGDIVPFKLPAIPKHGEPISPAIVARIETGAIAALPYVDSIAELDDWRVGAKAMEALLRSPELQRPMLGAQRHIEARIGQLLGPAVGGQPANFHRDGSSELIANHTDRMNFRLLGRALSGDCELTADEWRKSRRALVALVRWRLGLLPVTPLLPEGKFSCIIADPPWQQDTGGRERNTGAPARTVCQARAARLDDMGQRDSAARHLRRTR